jgi:hypothetical protein
MPRGNEILNGRGYRLVTAVSRVNGQVFSWPRTSRWPWKRDGGSFVSFGRGCRASLLACASTPDHCLPNRPRSPGPGLNGNDGTSVSREQQ